MTFLQWFEQHDWWNENSRRDELQLVWNTLTKDDKFTPLEAAAIIEAVIDAIRDEYGD